MIQERVEQRESGTPDLLSERVRSLRLPQGSPGGGARGGWVPWAICLVFAASTASSVVSSHSGGGKFVALELAVDAQIWAAGIFLTLLTGALGGLLPALSAMRLRPLEALR